MTIDEKQTDQFIEWFTKSLCHHEGALLMTHGILHCCRCFHNFPITDDLIERFYKEISVSASR